MITKKPKLPITRSMIKAGRRNGEAFKIDVSIVQTNDFDKYPPDGIKAIYRVLKIRTDVDEAELVVLIDNHKPFDYHEHDKLPLEHDSRKNISATNWQEAWKIFDLKIKEVIK